jgi:hypothetical protein
MLEPFVSLMVLSNLPFILEEAFVDTKVYRERHNKPHIPHPQASPNLWVIHTLMDAVH